MDVSLIEHLPQNPLFLTPTLALATIVLFQSLWGCARIPRRRPRAHPACRMPGPHYVYTMPHAGCPPASSARRGTTPPTPTPPRAPRRRNTRPSRHRPHALRRARGADCARQRYATDVRPALATRVRAAAPCHALAPVGRRVRARAAAMQPVGMPPYRLPWPRLPPLSRCAAARRAPGHRCRAARAPARVRPRATLNRRLSL